MLRETQGWNARALAICFFRREIHAATMDHAHTVSPVRLCSVSAMPRSSSVIRPPESGHSPIFLAHPESSGKERGSRNRGPPLYGVGLERKHAKNPHGHAKTGASATINSRACTRLAIDRLTASPLRGVSRRSRPCCNSRSMTAVAVISMNTRTTQPHRPRRQSGLSTMASRRSAREQNCAQHTASTGCAASGGGAWPRMFLLPARFRGQRMLFPRCLPCRDRPWRQARRAAPREILSTKVAGPPTGAGNPDRGAVWTARSVARGPVGARRARGGPDSTGPRPADDADATARVSRLLPARAMGGRAKNWRRPA